MEARGALGECAQRLLEPQSARGGVRGASRPQRMEPPLHLLTLNVKTVSQQFSVTVPASASVAQLKEEVGAFAHQPALTSRR